MDLGPIYIVCVGECEPDLVPLLQRELELIFGRPVQQAQPAKTALPGDAFSPLRRQFLSPKILRHLAKTVPARQRPLLGVTDVDLYVPGLNFVFGEADPAHTIGLISTYRLHYGLPRGISGKALFQSRVVKEAVHELGHVFGLGHCSDPHCVMFFSNTLADTDRKGKTFCSRCWSKLRQR